MSNKPNSKKKYITRFYAGLGVTLKGTISKKEFVQFANNMQKLHEWDRIDINLAKILDVDAVITSHEASIRWLIELTHPTQQEFYVNI